MRGAGRQFMYPKWELEQVYKLLVGRPERGRGAWRTQVEMRECVEICVTEVEFENVGWNFVRINVGLLRAKYSVFEFHETRCF